MKKFIVALILSLSLLVSSAEAGKYGNGTKSASTSSRSSSSSSSSSSRSSSPSPSRSSSSSSSVGSKPKSTYNSYDSAASSDKRKDDSQASFLKSKSPAPSVSSSSSIHSYAPSYGSSSYYTKPVYTTPSGYTKTVDTSSPSYSYLRGRLDESRYQQRPYRYRSFYGINYDRYSARPMVYYDDGYANTFWWWLRDQNYYTQAQYAYNHRSDMDPRRYNDLMMITGISDQVHYFEAQNAARTATWSPSGMDYDLMYNDNYINNVHDYSTAAPIGVIHHRSILGEFVGFILFCGAVVVLLVVVAVVFRA